MIRTACKFADAAAHVSLKRVRLASRKPVTGHADFNFDHPDAFDVAAIGRCLDALKRGEEAAIPVYNFTTHARAAETQTVKPVEVILFEGILVLHIPEILERLNMKVRATLRLCALAL